MNVFFLYYPWKQLVSHVSFEEFDSIAGLSNISQIIRSLVSIVQKLKLAIACFSFDHGLILYPIKPATSCY